MADDFISVTIDIGDVERIARKLNLTDAFSAGVQAGALHVKSVINVYPPSTDANVAGPYPKRWYVRGTGPHWARVDGTIGSERTSETLGRKWTVRAVNNGMGAVVGNNVSYARDVHDATVQKRYHKLRGWPTVQDVAQDEAPKVRDIIEGSIKAEIKRRGLS